MTPNSGATDEENALPLGPESQGPGASATIFHDIVAEFTASKGSAPVLAALALTEVWRGVITGEGPTASGRVHFSRTIDAEDTALCRRILIAAGGRTGTPVSREEADILIDIQEAVIERKDSGAFDELFAKAIAHHMIAAAGRAVPPRPVALASEKPLSPPGSPHTCRGSDGSSQRSAQSRPHSSALERCRSQHRLRRCWTGPFDICDYRLMAVGKTPPCRRTGRADMLKPMHETVARLEYRTSNASSH